MRDPREILAEEAYRQQHARDVEQLAEEAVVPSRVLSPGAGPAPQLPRIPEWVVDHEKWLTLSRPERRALERHHRKQGR